MKRRKRNNEHGDEEDQSNESRKMEMLLRFGPEHTQPGAQLQSRSTIKVEKQLKERLYAGFEPETAKKESKKVSKVHRTKIPRISDTIPRGMHLSTGSGNLIPRGVTGSGAQRITGRRRRPLAKAPSFHDISRLTNSRVQLKPKMQKIEHGNKRREVSLVKERLRRDLQLSKPTSLASVTNPDDFVRWMLQSPRKIRNSSGDFVYMKFDPKPSCGFCNCYDLVISSAAEIGLFEGNAGESFAKPCKSYFTVGTNGVWYIPRGSDGRESEYWELESWMHEREIFQKLVQKRCISNFKKRKYIYTWKNWLRFGKCRGGRRFSPRRHFLSCRNLLLLIFRYAKYALR